MRDEPTTDQATVHADIFISRNKQTHGPYPRDVVENWINTGKINEDDLACTDKTPWQPVTRLLWPEQFATRPSTQTTCPSCDHVNPGSQSSCEVCGATLGQPGSQSFQRRNLIIGVGVLVVFLFGSCAFVTFLSALSDSNKKARANEAKSLSLHATCSIGLTGVTVTNGDSFDYTNCELSIQRGVFTFYRASSPDIRSRESVTVSFFSFTDTDGQRFHYFKEKPQRILLSCKLRGQEGLTGWEFSR